VPPHRIPQETVKAQVRKLLPLPPQRLDAVMELFDNALVDSRFSVAPVAELGVRRGLTELMGIYQQHAVPLAQQVAAAALDRAGLRPRDVDLVITTSCTGVMLPSLDAHLVNDLGLRSDVRRLPITELGCLAGASALARAYDFLRGRPDAHVLVVAVELPTLSFQREDTSVANLVSTALFGDGAAAAVLGGRAGGGLAVVDTQAHLFPATLGTLGYDLRDDGFHVVLGPELPAVVAGGIGDVVDDLLRRARVPRAELEFFLLHPGGRRVLTAVERALGLGPAQTAPSWAVMRDFGNLSSATVLFLLEDWLARPAARPGAHGLLGAFGPGFSTELLLLRWN
jgi:alkylresorcinol/alkylpyrone synthase